MKDGPVELSTSDANGLEKTEARTAWAQYT